jgi:hypothetical protein
MWLVELFKAKEDAEIESEVFSTRDCNFDVSYIAHDDYTIHKLNLCNYWSSIDNKKILIIKKIPEQITLTPLRNERFMSYGCSVYYGGLHTDKSIIYLEYLEGDRSFMEFYVGSRFYVEFNVPVEFSSIESFLEYIKGKNLIISSINSSEPKYNVTFDDNCKYYHVYNPSYVELNAFVIVKNPFLLAFYFLSNTSRLGLQIAIKPKLMEEFNDYNMASSNYDPNADPPTELSSVINQYFDVNAKTGLSPGNISIHSEDGFGYNLIRALLGTFRGDITENYHFSLGSNIGILHPEDEYEPFVELTEMPLYIYFPLLRPQLDSNRFSRPWPQYNPNDANNYIYHFNWAISLNEDGSVDFSALSMLYGTDRHHGNYCYEYILNYMPSWRRDTCDFTLPFRFLGAARCDASDDWNFGSLIHNANYLFKLVKLPNSEYYSIKGVGCDELTENVNRFNDFSAEYTLVNSIATSSLDELHRISFSEMGYPIEEIRTTLSDDEIRNSKTCFVLFSESLVENATDFLSIYQALTSALPNPIVCYIGSDDKIPDSYKNKVIHSDAIVTDLNTGEAMPLVIKYIRYAKRLHQLFNG